MGGIRTSYYVLHKKNSDLGPPKTLEWRGPEDDESWRDIIGDAVGGAQLQLATSQLTLAKHTNQKHARLVTDFQCVSLL